MLTALHEISGSITSYLTKPTSVFPKLLEDKEICDVESYAFILILISLTSINQPQLMSDWNYIFKNNNWNSEIQQKLQPYNNNKRIG